MSSPTDETIRESGMDSYTLPARTRFNGPITARRLRRTAIVYAVIALIGLLPTLLGLEPAWRAFGLGLTLPGGGFLQFGWWALLGVTATLVVLAVSLVLWFATGNVIAPVATWLGSALVAVTLAVPQASTGHSYRPAVIAVVSLVVIAVVVGARRAAAVRRCTRVRAERTAYLPAELEAIFSRTARPATGEPRELDDIQLKHVRWLVDLGLQPVSEFAGFDVIEQFQPSALRYQINHVQYALAQVQRHYTPNFHGYLSTAQEHLIEKLTVPKVWKYWRLERLWGRLSTNYDPASFENIMLTGWSGICLNTYHANTGSTKFVDPGSLVFTLGNPKKTYRHDAQSFNDSLLMNFGRSPQTVYACEPNWTYSACNIYGINSVASYDAAFGTRHLDSVAEPFLRGMREELMDPAGNIIPFRSDYTGVPVAAGGELMFFQAAGWISPVYPQLARTLWAIACREILHVDEGGLETYLAQPWMVDAGNYRNTGLFCRAIILFAAREFGDTQVADAALRAMNTYNQPVESDGRRRYGIGSTYANALAAQALLTQPGDWTRLITSRPPQSVLNGPLLEHVAVEQAQVARAVSDGHDLRLVLRPAPGHDVSAAVKLGLARLRPRSSYIADFDGTATSITTDESGRAVLDVLLRDRTTVVIRPAT